MIEVKLNMTEIYLIMYGLRKLEAEHPNDIGVIQLLERCKFWYEYTLQTEIKRDILVEQ